MTRSAAHKGFEQNQWPRSRSAGPHCRDSWFVQAVEMQKIVMSLTWVLVLWPS